MTPGTPPTAERAPAAARWIAGAWLGRLLIGIVVLYIGVLILAPIAALTVGALAHGVGAIVEALGAPDALAALSLTLRISLITVAVNGVCGTVVAWVLARHRFRGRRILNGLIDLPFAISSVVVGYILILMFGRLSPLAPLEDALNVQIVFAVPGMILATIFVTLPFMFRELMPLMEQLDREQEHAAALLGAHRWQTFWWVTLPALRWGIIYGLVLTFARALGEFGAVLVVGGAIQGMTETVPLYVFRALDERNTAAAYGMALLLGVISLALVLGIERFRTRE